MNNNQVTLNYARAIIHRGELEIELNTRRVISRYMSKEANLLIPLLEWQLGEANKQVNITRDIVRKMCGCSD